MRHKVRHKSQDTQGKANDLIKQLLSYPSMQELRQKQSRNWQKQLFYSWQDVSRAVSLKAVFSLPITGSVICSYPSSSLGLSFVQLKTDTGSWPKVPASGLLPEPVHWAGANRAQGTPGGHLGEGHVTRASTVLPQVQWDRAQEPDGGFHDQIHEVSPSQHRACFAPRLPHFSQHGLCRAQAAAASRRPAAQEAPIGRFTPHCPALLAPLSPTGSPWPPTPCSPVPDSSSPPWLQCKINVSTRLYTGSQLSAPAFS